MCRGGEEGRGQQAPAHDSLTYEQMTSIILWLALKRPDIGMYQCSSVSSHSHTLLSPHAATIGATQQAQMRNIHEVMSPSIYGLVKIWSSGTGQRSVREHFQSSCGPSGTLSSKASVLPPTTRTCFKRRLIAPTFISTP